MLALGANIFAPPAHLAVRRSWFAKTLEREADGWFFANLLRDVAPARYRELVAEPPLPDGMAYYNALMAHCETLFPVFELDLEFDVEEWAADEGVSLLRALRHYGIPTDAMGFEDEDYYFGRGDPDVAVILAMQSARIGPAAFKEHLEQARSALREKRFWNEALEHAMQAGIHKRWYVPPRGRTWRQPWDGLRDVVSWINHSTGNLLLDYSHLAIQESGEYPPWDAGEIRGFAAEWKLGRTVWDRIEALRKHIDSSRDKPGEMLTLAGILSGDARARQANSVTKVGRGPTLADVFARESLT